MADGRKPEPTVEDRLRSLAEKLGHQQRSIEWMQGLGGFADAKTLSVRSKRIEDRVEMLERDVKMLLDVAGLQASLAEALLEQKLGMNLERSNEPAVIYFRKVRRRLGEWAEACKLKIRRIDVTDARLDENRIRPRSAPSPAHS
jgi:hypothetical protein